MIKDIREINFQKSGRRQTEGWLENTNFHSTFLVLLLSDFRHQTPFWRYDQKGVPV